MATFSLSGRHELRIGSPAETEHFRKHGCTPVPRFIQWMATLRCELSCPHCLADGPGAGAPDMPLAAVERLLDQVAELGIGEFLVTGGEPAVRPDLPEVVAMLRERGIRWSLNTAVNPGARLRAAMAAHPPSFVAVSLDGPERVHDRFRGRRGAHRDALEAIRYYAGVVPSSRVTAGTTVTARNFGQLAETFPEVVRSGATSWGLHLLVPEGRARTNRRLFLSRRQLGALIDFCAARRAHFPVSIADEPGYLGAAEPLVREAPFFCGAGRTQCVVLPGGEVVPCTTIDRSASAGNVFERPLAEIWAEGFADLRRWEPAGRCRGCECAPACRGGCWLQRRAGTQCFKAVWAPRPRLAAATAGIALCLGLGATVAGAGEPAAQPPEQQIDYWELGDLSLQSRATTLETWIIQWYAAQPGAARRGKVEWKAEDFRQAAERDMKDDPAGPYFLKFAETRGKEEAGTLKARCQAVAEGLKTRQVSLSLACVMWQDLAEACLEGKDSQARGAEEQKLLRETMTELESRTARWRRLILAANSTRMMNVPVHGLMMKAQRVRPEEDVLWQVSEERWKGAMEAAEWHIGAHPAGESLTLGASPKAGAELALVRGGKQAAAAADFELRAFDVLKTSADKPVDLTLSGPDGALKAAVKLPPGSELSYADVLRLAWEQNRKELDAAARAGSASPLVLPALRALERELEAKPEAAKPGSPEETLLRSARVRLMNLWLF